MKFTTKIGVFLDSVSPKVGAKSRGAWRLMKNAFTKTCPDFTKYNIPDKYIKESINAVAVMDSIRRINEPQRDSSRVAIITVAPPSKTGIANFSVKTFYHCSSNIDIYFPHEGSVDYFTTLFSVNSYSDKLKFYSIDSFFYGVRCRSYDYLIFVLGNSEHNIDVAKTLRRCANVNGMGKIFIEIHDPVLIHLAAKIHFSDGMEIDVMIRKFYNISIDGETIKMAAYEDYKKIVGRGVYGIKAITSGVKVDGVIVHSSAAAEIVTKELPFAADNTCVLYHPVFEDFYFEKIFNNNLEEIKIASFGIPGNHKETATVINAFRIIHRKYPGASLILAGYGVDDYVIREHLANEAGVNYYDSPSDEDLIDIMRGVDIAVQLRNSNTGESSGVVPQLIAANVSIICSAVGAFLDYKDAVRYVQPGCSSEDLVEVIIQEFEDCSVKSANRIKYLQTHRPRDFCEKLEFWTRNRMVESYLKDNTEGQREPEVNGG